MPMTHREFDSLEAADRTLSGEPHDSIVPFMLSKRGRVHDGPFFFAPSSLLALSESEVQRRAHEAMAALLPAERPKLRRGFMRPHTEHTPERAEGACVCSARSAASVEP